MQPRMQQDTTTINNDGDAFFAFLREIVPDIRAFIYYLFCSSYKISFASGTEFFGVLRRIEDDRQKYNNENDVHSFPQTASKVKTKTITPYVRSAWGFVDKTTVRNYPKRGLQILSLYLVLTPPCVVLAKGGTAQL